MSAIFNADEVFEMAEQIERNGRRFYQRAAQQTADSSVKAVFDRLADMESDHEALFGEMRAKAAKEGLPRVEYDPNLDVPHYLQAAADTHVFNVHKDLAVTLTGRESTEAVLRLAIEFEKDTVVFFLGLKELVSQDLGKDKVERLIREEMSHITILTTHLRSLQR